MYHLRILKGLKKNMDDLISDIAKKADDAMKSLFDVGTENLDEGLDAAALLLLTVQQPHILTTSPIFYYTARKCIQI